MKENQPAFFSPRDKHLKGLFFSLAAKHGLEVEGIVFNHSHLHAVLALRDRKSYHGFIRELNSKIVLGLSKTIGISLRGIFLSRPFTRIANWGRPVMILGRYLKKNEKESGVLQASSGHGLRRLWQVKNGADYWASVDQLSYYRDFRETWCK